MWETRAKLNASECFTLSTYCISCYVFELFYPVFSTNTNPKFVFLSQVLQGPPRLSRSH